MNISTRQLAAFLAVARLGSFTRAAEQIHITQAGLSLMLRDMETQLECRLFDRTTRAVWLTEGGTRLLPVAERMLRDLQEAVGQLGKLTSTADSSIVVAATPLVCASVMPTVCRLLEESHPGIKVVVKDAERPRIQSMVEAGEAELGLGVLFKPSSAILRQPLLKIPLVCVGPRDAPWLPRRTGRSAGTRTWSQLRNVPLIGLPPANAIQQLVDDRLKQIGRANESRPTFGNLLTLIAMAEAGYGAAVLPSFVRAACHRYAVDVDVMTSPRTAMDFYAITRKGSVAPSALQPFVACFTAQMTLYGVPGAAPQPQLS